MIKRLESQLIHTSFEPINPKAVNRIAKIVYGCLCLKHWLPGWCYPRGLIVNQKRYRIS